MSQEFTEEELDAFEVEMGSENPDLQPDAPADEVVGDDNAEPEANQEQPDGDTFNLAAQPEVNETGETPDDSKEETNLESETQVNTLAEYLKNTPMEAKSKSARFLIDTPEKLQESINKSLDYHKKTAELSQWRGNIEVMTQGGLTRDDLILLSEAKKGNKEALAALAGSSNIDLYDVQNEDAENFAPTQHYATEQELEINMVAEEIQSDPVVSEQFVEYIPDMPADFKNLLNTNPQALRGFADDIRSGVAQKIYGEALSSQAMYGGDFLGHYQNVGQRVFANGGQPSAPAQAAPQQPSQQQEPQAPVMSDRERDLREKAAATTQRQNSGGKTFLADANSIWDMDEADFDKLSPEDLRKMG